jgi:hypothetical protein
MSLHSCLVSSVEGILVCGGSGTPFGCPDLPPADYAMQYYMDSATAFSIRIKAQGEIYSVLREMDSEVCGMSCCPGDAETDYAVPNVQTRAYRSSNYAQRYNTVTD